MCTVSWCNQPDGYTLFFNRDESRKRPAAIPPDEKSIRGTRILSPTDPEGGGTWLLINQTGLSLGLLNYYEARVNYQPPNRKSRGLLPLKFAPYGELSELKRALEKTDFSHYPPLHFLAVDTQSRSLLMTWDGQNKSFSNPRGRDLPISTSSFATQNVAAARKAEFCKQLALASDPVEALEAFHTNAAPGPATHAALMSRPDAKTVSVTRIYVSANRVHMRYQARPDDTPRLSSPITLSMARA